MSLHRVRDLLSLTLCFDRSPPMIYSSRSLIGANNILILLFCSLALCRSVGDPEMPASCSCGWPCINHPSLFLSLCLRRAWGVGQCSGSVPLFPLGSDGRVAVLLPLLTVALLMQCVPRSCAWCSSEVQRGAVFIGSALTGNQGMADLLSSGFDRLPVFCRSRSVCLCGNDVAVFYPIFPLH